MEDGRGAWWCHSLSLGEEAEALPGAQVLSLSRVPGRGGGGVDSSGSRKAPVPGGSVAEPSSQGTDLINCPRCLEMLSSPDVDHLGPQLGCDPLYLLAFWLPRCPASAFLSNPCRRICLLILERETSM